MPPLPGLTMLECHRHPPAVRSCKKMDNLTRRRRHSQRTTAFFLSTLCDFAPWREMHLLVLELFHSFCSRGPQDVAPIRAGL
jgi:hypothetical protein